MKKLERKELGKLKGGQATGPTTPIPGSCLGQFCISIVNCLCWGEGNSSNGIACFNNRCSHQ